MFLVSIAGLPASALDPTVAAVNHTLAAHDLLFMLHESAARAASTFAKVATE